MGLSSKQVSSDGLGWNQALLQTQTPELPKANSPMKRQHPQNQQQQTEPPLKCPRCDSSNTKFCYYNNYNKSQPRHFCKACKRHWTKGGTLRNVPVGGGRKNKRLKTSNTNTATASAASAADPAGTRITSTAIKRSTSSGFSNRLAIQPQQQQQQRQDLQVPVLANHQKNTSNMQFQAVQIHPQSSFKSLCNNDLFLGSSSILCLPHQSRGLQMFPFSSSISSSSFETTPSSISNSFQSSSIYNYSTSGETMEYQDPTITSNITVSQPWQVPAAITNSTTDIPNYWNWDDINIDALVSTDLNIPWYDSEIKP